MEEAAAPRACHVYPTSGLSQSDLISWPCAPKLARDQKHLELLVRKQTLGPVLRWGLQI